MKKALLLVALFAAMAGKAHTVKHTFVYAVKGVDSLRLDRYELLSASSGPKPCMLFVFGGGFVAGERDEARYRPYFEYYAEQGYVVVSIDYRLGMKQAMERGALSEQTFPTAWMQTLSMAVEDLYDATAFVVKNATAWHLDPQRIVASGSSAGAITVLMGEYGICNSSPLTRHLPDGFDYAGVVSFAGAIFDETGNLQWRRTPAPMLLFHGDADRNVPYGTIEYEGVGFYGSKAIADVLTARRIPHYFYSAADTDHVMATQPMDENRYVIDDFLEKLVRQRLPLIIDTRATPLDAPSIQKNFSLEDYIRSNFGEE